MHLFVRMASRLPANQMVTKPCFYLVNVVIVTTDNEYLNKRKNKKKKKLQVR